MSYILEILNDFNKLFQSDSPLLHKLKPETTRLLKTVCNNFIDKEVLIKEQKNILNLNHTNPHHFVSLENIYLGVAANETLQEVKSEDNHDETEMMFS